MNATERYEAVVIGGGLAGLSTAISLAGKGHRVLLLEKEKYPFHKVCGEYISLESYPYLESLGLPLGKMELPVITRLMLTTRGGIHIGQQLPLGGFGISRFLLDHALVKLAREKGVEVMEGVRVTDVLWKDDFFEITAGERQIKSSFVVAAHGKRSNLDVTWKRSFIQHRPDAKNHYIGIKYHVKNDHPADTIGLHLFKGGYCGVSPIENNLTCICYLTTASVLKEHGNNIGAMEARTLRQNQSLNQLFQQSEKVYESPLVISQVSFERKELVSNHILFAGDAAGLIAPLCGNGMSMALLGGALLSEPASAFLKGIISRQQMEQEYRSSWKNAFGQRLYAGRILQQLFNHERLSSLTLQALSYFPGVINGIIRKTHGRPYRSEYSAG